ncbi:DNA adenine methylase [Muricauda sp. SCSIO 64092]|uniref:DNA adenine methylase n=1 Tax=Allomuricauda sp. SCSIO 64092 TaxID=2908842 RepID=UPI001FF313A7|nr:DNA adenine methylase [Muricauda sp. SCSIO 64092]UOY05337.1 DNA adenine methylase [Muricauda sp. SCSIO 64092]
MHIISEETKVVLRDDVPHIVKYMGSKRELIPFLIQSINEIYEGEPICDLFAGSSILSGAIGTSVTMYSNDIQEYSSVFAKTYLGSYNWDDHGNLIDELIAFATAHVNLVKEAYPNLEFTYDDDLTLEGFNTIEKLQQDLIFFEFNDVAHHLFIKNYSGTYWSYEQCLWIDGLRIAAEKYAESSIYYPILSSIMFAMSYNAQSTGHFAQYRDASNAETMHSIILYRKKEIVTYFKRKLGEIMVFTGANHLNHQVTARDYRDCLDSIPEGTLVYADPPYSFMHYSRFYHALETLVKYDYPEVQFKGRYRNDRHQSPFCKRSEVKGAFEEMFEKIKSKKAKLVLSYSNTGMISLESLLDIAHRTFGNTYKVMVKEIDYIHSTMGRIKDKSREVTEYLVIANPV